MTERRVVVTGVGAVTPLGVGAGAFWDALVSAKCGITAISLFDATPFDVRVGGECRAFDPTGHVDHRKSKRMDRFAQFAFVSAKEAVEESGFNASDQFDPERAGVILGTGIGGLWEIEEQHRRLLEKGPARVSAFTIPKLMPNAGSGHISIEFNCQGVNTCVATACASAGSAMGDAFMAIRSGQADAVITGGAEASMTPLGLAAFASMKALSTRNDAPEKSSRPFDKGRDGFVLSEGAGLLIFEEYERAKKRGAKIYAEVLGYGASADAGDMVQPDPEGRGAGRAMRAALKSARISPDEVDYINCHGTSTPLGDKAEVRAIRSVFGAAADKLAISSIKGAIGHTLGASGGIEAVASVQAIQHNTLPPTINVEDQDPACDLDVVPNTARDARVNVVLSNSFGFGGHNACLVFRNV